MDHLKIHPMLIQRERAHDKNMNDPNDCRTCTVKHFIKFDCNRTNNNKKEQKSPTFF